MTPDSFNGCSGSSPPNDDSNELLDVLLDIEAHLAESAVIRAEWDRLMDDHSTQPRQRRAL